MKIQSIHIRLCRRENPSETTGLATGERSKLDYLVISIETEDGCSGHSFGFAGKSAEVAGMIAAKSIKPWMLGRNAWHREALWQESRFRDRWWGHSPIYSYGPFDVALWNWAGRAVGQPVYRLLGAFRKSIPVYASSMQLPTPQSYAEEAMEVVRAGLRGYKIHPPGTFDADLETYRLCREAVGPDFILMADPVGAHHYDEALKMGRELEKLNYHWFEEPLPDSDLIGLKKLSRDLDIPVVGTEVAPGAHYAIAQAIEQGAVDRVRSDVSWKGGITSVMRAADMAEAFNMPCELHTTIYHPLELANLHCACAMRNCEFLEILWPSETFAFGLKSPLPIDDQGIAHVPDKPGLGIDLDWPTIENETFEIL